MPTRFVTRFAPSPTGHLHLGHAFSALTAWEAASAAGGAFLLRIEDLDGARVRPDYETAIYEDLTWLGLTWHGSTWHGSTSTEPVLRQSERLDVYAKALERLGGMGVLYPCRCTRADIRAALAAPQEGASHASGGAIYPGTCRGRPMAACGPKDAIRLDLGRALALLNGQTLTWRETGPARAGAHRLDPQSLRQQIGDVVLARKDTGAAAYHLAVVVDDAAQAITHVIRGEDLLDVTQIHRLLQALLELPVPVWHHHPLVRDETGRRLAKRSDAFAIRALRAAGKTAEDVLQMARRAAEGEKRNDGTI